MRKLNSKIRLWIRGLRSNIDKRYSMKKIAGNKRCSHLLGKNHYKPTPLNSKNMMKLIMMVGIKVVKNRAYR